MKILESVFKARFAKVVSGKLYEYLKDIEIFGREDETEDFIVFGCKDEDQERFYQGILEYDKITKVQDFETIEDVKEWWEDGGDMMLYIDKGDFEIVERET